jgi:DNA modification methylase
VTVRIYTGDARTVLASLPERSVQMCVTSPPYFGLRDYNVEGQIGLEPTVDEYVSALVDVFREVRRVLKDDGTCWVNLGDSYATKRAEDIKPKDLMGVPWTVALALRADGWYLRQDIIWHKTNPMPESSTDRCTSSHEYLFLLSKSARYYYDHNAIKEPMKDVSLARLSQPNVMDQKGGPKDSLDGNRSHRKTLRNQAERLIKHEKWKDRFEGWDEYDKSLGRNKRSVWEVAIHPLKDAHFATFPPKLIEPCILAGSKEGDTVLDPFGGSGTTGLVSDRLNRDAILIDLNPKYVDMARKRITKDAPMLVDVEVIV